MSLTGKVALVTGAAVRLGKAIALALAEDGADLCLHYGRSQDDARQTLHEVEGLGRQAIAVSADFTNPEQAATELFQQAVDRFGRVDILVNSAAIFEPATIHSFTADVWQRHLAINLTAPLFLSQAFAAAHTAGQAGQIVNILDWRASTPTTGYLPYSISKAGLLALTRNLALELAPEIRVNGISPGAILPAPEASDAEFAKLAEAIPLKRTGDPQQIIQALRYLLAAEFVTGEVIHVTGGQHLA